MAQQYPQAQPYPQAQQAYPQQAPYDGGKPSHPRFMEEPKQVWSTGLCECFSDCSSCIDIYCCLVCQLSRQCNKTEGGDGLSIGYCLVGCCCMANMMWAIRSRMVAKYNIMEDGCKTCCVIQFCYLCAICQQYRELSARDAWPGGCVCASEPPVIEAKAFVNPNIR